MQGGNVSPLELSPVDMRIATAGSHHAQEAETQFSRIQEGSCSSWRSYVHVPQWHTLLFQLLSACAVCRQPQIITSAQTFKNHLLWSGNSWCAKQEADLHCGQGECIIPAHWACHWFIWRQFRDCFRSVMVLFCNRNSFFLFPGRYSNFSLFRILGCFSPEFLWIQHWFLLELLAAPWTQDKSLGCLLTLRLQCLFQSITLKHVLQNWTFPFNTFIKLSIFAVLRVRWYRNTNAQLHPSSQTGRVLFYNNVNQKI